MIRFTELSLDEIKKDYLYNSDDLLECNYENFVQDWQDEYGPRPDDCVPTMDSDDFKMWLQSNISKYDE